MVQIGCLDFYLGLAEEAYSGKSWKRTKRPSTKKNLEPFFIRSQGPGKCLKRVSIFSLSVGQFVCKYVFFGVTLPFSTHECHHAQTKPFGQKLHGSEERPHRFLTKKRLPKPSGKKRKWHLFMTYKMPGYH